jgi:hypothetical protein
MRELKQENAKEREGKIDPEIKRERGREKM